MNFLQNLFGKKQSPELLTAVETGDLEKVKAILTRGVNLETRGGMGGYTPLQIAARKGYKDIVKLLLDAGANVNARSEKLFDTTALHVAVEKGHEDIVEMLIAVGADVNAKAKTGRTPLHHIATSDIGTLLLLTTSGANLQAMDSSEINRLYVAKYEEFQRIIELLRNAGADLNAMDDSGLSPLHVAVSIERQGRADIVKLLLNGGVNANAKTNDGITPLHMAVLDDHKDLVELLLNSGADINAKDARGFTPLEIATLKNNQDMAELLHRHGAKG